MSETEPYESSGEAATDEAGRRVRLFAERLFSRLPPDLADEYPPEKRIAIASSAFEFFAGRRDALAVRVLGGGNGRGRLTVETAMTDCAFIVDSLLEYFRKREIPVRLLLHPLFSVARDAERSIISFESGSAGESAESFVHLEVDAALAATDRGVLATDLRRVLELLREATDDFGAMTARALQICEETAAARELVEIRDFLRWLVQGGFVFIGYRRYRIVTHDGQRALALDSGSSLGIMRSEIRSRYATPQAIDSMEPTHRQLLFDNPALIIGKARAESEIHRRAPMDDVTIRRTDQSGNVIGFDRFIGLFTSKAYAEEAQHIPVLRAKLSALIAAEGAQPGTHDYKALVAAFNTLPKEELFRAPVEELRTQLRVILDVQRESEVRLSIENDTVRGYVMAMVIMPRERFSAEVRVRIQELLAARLGGNLVYYNLALGESYTARLHFCFATRPIAPPAIPAIEREVAALARSWDDVLREELAARYGEARGRELTRRWMPAFGARYKSAASAASAIRDIEQFERMIKDGVALAVTISAADGASDGASELRLYELSEAPSLTELIPTLQNFGIAVISEDAHEIRLALESQPRAAYVQAFSVRSLDGSRLDALPGAALIAEAIVAVRSERAVDDQLNTLTLRAALAWREVSLLRAYLAAAFQMRLAPARIAAQRPLLLYPKLARTLVDFFKARLGPAAEASATKEAGLRADYIAQLGAVDNISDDRMARTLLAMVEATVRANYFRELPVPDPYIAIKFESARIPSLPDTPPLYEIHVHSPRMEGCHLRAGRIARGGIRYSDRPDDYRTEILDLMKTQTVKNAIIVPMGSKGGFVVKSRPGRVVDPQAVVAAYSTLMNAMLDLTDNLEGEKIVHPQKVKVLDTDGPYLVVAADKGTAAFSDIANNIAEQRGFWLGDAFASGGEHGFDHKKLGITARGAWESAKRHLREMGRTLEHGAPVTVVGIGDMSGDVFGNGMLQSANLKLIAAFDHRHIFIDPDPDPARSFVERRRLYDKPGSQWSDYDPALISAGGGIYRRGQKQIVLSPQARAALQCEAAELDADTVIRAILRAPADMLYNGGVGTYVRAASESDAEVGDHTNDSCRITAGELRCKMVVEGGNLGFTQRARIDYALAGGRINNDAIDNSAGVDMSDHEVNLKILMRPAVTAGAITAGQRNRQLAEAADTVAASVLRDNRDQVLSISLEQLRSRVHVGAFRDHLTAIEQRGLLRRYEPALPTHEELRERRSRFSGLTRPEIAVLTAYTKIDLAATFTHTPLVGHDYLVDRFLRSYFPPAIAEAFANEIPRHGLRRELIATRVANELVDLMGSVFVFNLMRDFGVEAEEAVRAWLIAEGILELRERAERLKAGATEFAAEAELSGFLALERATRHVCAWVIANPEPAATLGSVVARFKPGFDRLAADFEPTLSGGERDRFDRLYRELRAAVHQEQLALELARLAFADHLLNLLSLSIARGLEPEHVAAVYFGLSSHFEFAMLEEAIDAINSEDRWERRAARDLGIELTWARTQICCTMLDRLRDGSGASVGSGQGARDAREAEVARLMGDLRALRTIGLPPLQVTVRALSRLARNP